VEGKSKKIQRGGGGEEKVKGPLRRKKEARGVHRKQWQDSTENCKGGNLGGGGGEETYGPFRAGGGWEVKRIG